MVFVGSGSKSFDPDPNHLIWIRIQPIIDTDPDPGKWFHGSGSARLNLKCDLSPLRPHCGEAPGRDSNLGPTYRYNFEFKRIVSFELLWILQGFWAGAARSWGIWLEPEPSLWPSSIRSQFLKIPKFCYLLLGVVEKEHNQAIRRYAAYSRGTRGGPPTPPAPGKFFNEQTFNDQTFNDQTFNDQTFNDRTMLLC